jgi:hypothetical protein
MNVKMVACSEGEQQADGFDSDNRRKCLVVVDSWNLGEAFGNESGFVACDRAVCVVFEAENPFTGLWEVT